MSKTYRLFGHNVTITKVEKFTAPSIDNEARKAANEQFKADNADLIAQAAAMRAARKSRISA